MYGCVSANTSGLTRSANRARLRRLRRALGEQLQFSFALDIEQQDARTAGRGPFQPRFCRCLKRQPAPQRRDPPPERVPVRLRKRCRSPRRVRPAGERISSDEIRLHGITDKVIDRLEGPPEQSKPLDNVLRGVDVERRSVPPRQCVERDAIALHRRFGIRPEKGARVDRRTSTKGFFLRVSGELALVKIGEQQHSRGYRPVPAVLWMCIQLEAEGAGAASHRGHQQPACQAVGRNRRDRHRSIQPRGRLHHLLPKSRSRGAAFHRPGTVPSSPSVSPRM